jgi:hypothetical protein
MGQEDASIVPWAPTSVGSKEGARDQNPLIRLEVLRMDCEVRGVRPIDKLFPRTVRAIRMDLFL